jgi:protein-tyrosine-phosphatase
MSFCPSVFKVAFVCTGNQARSPLAEALFRRYAGTVQARATSFGTAELPPSSALPFAIEAGRVLGVDLSAHRSRPLTDNALAAEDLVVGFEPFHVSFAVLEGGAERGKVFLLTELVPLLLPTPNELEPVSRARSAVEDADNARSLVGSRQTLHGIQDPARSGRRGMLRTAREIDALVRKLVVELFGRISNS